MSDAAGTLEPRMPGVTAKDDQVGKGGQACQRASRESPPE